ncbi:MAG: hypothetical protein II119_02935 [Bacilli bacterium]|nr:hypothetical protein [Bacilli bacterium]
MEGNKKGQQMLIVALIAAIVTMSVGFAITSYTTTLAIEGNTITAKAAKWDVHFDDASYVETTGTGYVAATSHALSGTTLTYAVTLEPKQIYEATVTVKNEGTFDANLTGLTLAGLSADQAKYIHYSVFYNGTEYTETNNSLSIALAKSTGTATVKVRVEYYLPDDAADLPATDAQLTLTSSLTYTQAS